MLNPMANWKLNDKITDSRELELRICQVLEPHVVQGGSNVPGNYFANDANEPKRSQFLGIRMIK